MRSQRWYRRNEKRIMRELGLEPTPGSGSGWIVKEDGQTDNLIAQLKSTDAAGIGIKLFDIQRLEQNAAISNKRPVFVIQFLRDNSVYLLVRPDDDILEVLHRNPAIETEELADDIHILNESISDERPQERQQFYEKREVTRNEQTEAYRKVRRAKGKEKRRRQLEPDLPL